MIEPARFYAALRRNGLSFFTGVPDSLLKDLCAYISDQVPVADHVIDSNEGAAVALAAGYHLATGRSAVVYLQNSGLGNAVNPLLSLADPAVYGIPMLLVIGWRGEPGVADEPQHVAQGRATEKLLDTLQLPSVVLDAETADVDEVVAALVARMEAERRPVAILVRKNTFASYEPTRSDGRLGLSRARAIDVVLTHLGSDVVTVATTGMTSREVYAFREAHGQGHTRDFLTVGSMGHSSQIALGLASQRPDLTVLCLDGDGATIMHMGSLAIIGSMTPANFHHIILNNGAHDSVGGQPTAGLDIDLCGVARACGYRSASSSSTEADVVEHVAAMGLSGGPSMLEIKVASQPWTDAGRPTTSPSASKEAFMTALGTNAD